MITSKTLTTLMALGGALITLGLVWVTLGAPIVASVQSTLGKL